MAIIFQLLACLSTIYMILRHMNCENSLSNNRWFCFLGCLQVVFYGLDIYYMSRVDRLFLLYFVFSLMNFMLGYIIFLVVYFSKKKDS